MRVELSEFGRTAVQRSELERAAGISLKQLDERLRPFVRVRRSLDSANVVFKAGPHVGTRIIGRVRIDVRPTLAPENLTSLIRYALGGRIKATGRSLPLAAKVGLDELIGSVLAEELTVLRGRGVARRYIDRAEPVRQLRGRPLFEQSFPWDAEGVAYGRSPLVCRYHELTADVLDNRLIRAGLEAASRLQLLPETRRAVMDHRLAWSALATQVFPVPDDFAVARSQYSRLTEHYRLAHRLCELILFGGRPAEVFQAGTEITGGLVLSMPWLFESFVARLLSESLAPLGLRVEAQSSDREALVDGAGKRYRHIRPDLLVFDTATEFLVAVIDAKYKRYAEADASGRPRRRISNGDLYQLFFYAQRLARLHDLNTPPDAIIICPTLEEPGEHQLRERFRRVRFMAGGGIEAKLHLEPVSMPRALQGLLSDLSPFAVVSAGMTELVLRFSRSHRST